MLRKIHIFKLMPSVFQNIQHRNGSYQTSIFAVDAEVTTKYEKTAKPEEWKFVERLLPPTVVPAPKKLEVYPSQWKPQSKSAIHQPYFIPRTKNHMMPVYLKIMRRGQKRHTIIQHIQGDIWLLEQQLRPFIADLIKPSPLRLQVDEFAGKIRMNGDHVNAIKHWLSEKGF